MRAVSVVVCTLDRADGLRDTLTCLRQQRYDDFEVIVVNGPSTDHTDEVLREFAADIRVRRCPQANLSMSRNIGIRAAAGEIVAFIDDDALPEFDWLAQAVACFDEHDVAGVGGIVFDHTGHALQFRFSASNRFGETTHDDHRPFDDFCFPGSFTFPYLQGTNALFRRSALLEVGGFDETFDYYLDETDLCGRLADAGWSLRQRPDAPVHHKFLPSSIRDHQRVVTNWFPIVKNQVYFSYRHAFGTFDEAEVLRRCQAHAEQRASDARAHEQAGLLPAGTAERASITISTAFAQGLAEGRAAVDRPLPPLVSDNEPLHRYPTIDTSRRKRIVVVSADYTPHITGGIARWFGDVAPALARLGHEVRVITRGEHQSTVDLEDGVWVHRLAVDDAGGVATETLPHIDQFISAVAEELERIGRWAPIDVVYGPAWDVEVLGALRRTPLPVAALLATPVAVALTQDGTRPQDLAPTIRTLLRLETEVFGGADLVHAISSAIVDTVDRGYDAPLAPQRTFRIPLGLRAAEPPSTVAAITKDTKDARDVVDVVFVGRLESRKGIQELLAVVETIAPYDDRVRFTLVGADTPAAGGEGLVGQQWLERWQGATWLDRVHLTGPVDDETLHAHYERADIVVLPSRYESFGLVVLEAMMHGRALISCATGGITEIVTPGVDGLLVEPNDVDQLRAAVRTLLDDPAMRRRLGDAARTTFTERFTVSTAAANVDALVQATRRVGVGECFQLFGPCQPVVTPGGGTGALLHAGACVELSVTAGPTIRLPVRADDYVELLVESPGAVRAMQVAAGDWQRLDLGTPAGPLRVTLLTGTAVLAPFLETDVAAVQTE